jgi:hypothetical protein
LSEKTAGIFNCAANPDVQKSNKQRKKNRNSGKQNMAIV